LQLDDEGDFLFDDNDEYAAFLEELQAPWDALPVRTAGGASFSCVRRLTHTASSLPLRAR
jgi:hypothetical protein